MRTETTIHLAINNWKPKGLINSKTHEEAEFPKTRTAKLLRMNLETLKALMWNDLWDIAERIVELEKKNNNGKEG